MTPMESTSLTIDQKLDLILIELAIFREAIPDIQETLDDIQTDLNEQTEAIRNISPEGSGFGIEDLT